VRYSLNFVDDQGIELVALGWDGEKSPWKPISEEVGKDCRCEQARNNIDICVCVCVCLHLGCFECSRLYFERR